jgi:hypothetical protein
MIDCSERIKLFAEGEKVYVSEQQLRSKLAGTTAAT